MFKENAAGAVEAELVIGTGQSEYVQGFAVIEVELLQVKLDSWAEEPVMESAGCHDDNEADTGCES